jgi:hypothetical protein
MIVPECETPWMSKSPASNQPPTASPGMRSSGWNGVLVVAPVRYASKCCSFAGLHRLGLAAVGPDLDERRGRQRCVVRVELDDGALRLRRVVADFREADDRRPRPVGDRVRLDVPLGDLAGGLRGEQGPHDVPAVLGEVASVEQLQLA